MTVTAGCRALGPDQLGTRPEPLSRRLRVLIHRDLVQGLRGAAGGEAFEACLADATLWDMLASLVRAARAAGKPLAVCGALAQHSAHVQRLVAAGIEAISVSPRLIGTLRRTAADALARRPAAS